MSIQYIKSSKIDVFPAGFRGQDFPASKISTEKNLSLLGRAARGYNSAIYDPFASSYIIIILRGYIFRFSAVDMPAGNNLYACIRLRKISVAANDPVGEVLAPVDSSITSTALDIAASSGEYNFVGLGFSTSELSGANIYQLRVRDASGNFIETRSYTDALTSGVYNTVGGTTINSELQTGKLTLSGLSTAPGVLKANAAKEVTAVATLSASDLASISGTSAKVLQASGSNHTLEWIDKTNPENGAFRVDISTNSSSPSTFFTANQSNNSTLLFNNTDFEITTDGSDTKKKIIKINPSKDFTPAQYLKNATINESTNTLTLTRKDGAAFNYQAAKLTPSTTAKSSVAELKALQINDTWYNIPSGGGISGTYVTSIDYLRDQQGRFSYTESTGTIHTLGVAQLTTLGKPQFQQLTVKTDDASIFPKILLTPDALTATYAEGSNKFQLKFDGSQLCMYDWSGASTTPPAYYRFRQSAEELRFNNTGYAATVLINGNSGTITAERFVGPGNITDDGDAHTVHVETILADSLDATNINVSNTVTCKKCVQTSDARLKTNIVPYQPEKSILELPLKKFDFIDGPKNQIGCLAQDLQQICPQIVTENPKGYLAIQESKIVYLLIDEVKKLKAEIQELKERT